MKDPGTVYSLSIYLNVADPSEYAFCIYGRASTLSSLGGWAAGNLVRHVLTTRRTYEDAVQALRSGCPCLLYMYV